MKKGFTMIELIFVIVILGILASVAIPRLTGTREDAEISAGIANLRTLISDAASYRAAKGNLIGTKWRDFTNVPLKKADGNAIDSTAPAVGYGAFIAVGGKNCLQVFLRDSDTSTYFAFKTIANNNDPLCTAVLASTPVKQILDSTLPNNGSGDGTENCTGVNNQGVSCVAISSGSIYETKVNNTANQPQNP